MLCFRSWQTEQSYWSGSTLVLTACLIGSWQCVHSILCSVTWFLCMKSISEKWERRAGSLWHWKQRSFFASPSPWMASRWQFWQATCRTPTNSLWLNLASPILMSPSGAPWQFPHPPMGFSERPSFAPLKWHKKQVLEVTSMWFPTTIWLWQLVHRSFFPRLRSVRWGLWSNLILIGGFPVFTGGV